MARQHSWQPAVASKRGRVPASQSASPLLSHLLVPQQCRIGMVYTGRQVAVG